jgi:predicted nucleic acid-binding protein
MRSLVVDASAIVEQLCNLGGRQDEVSALIDAATVLAAPAHLDVEVLSSLRRGCSAGQLEDDVVAYSLQRLRHAPIERVAVAGLLRPSWELRHNVAMRDAPYVVLAAARGWSLLTTDAKLAGAPLVNGVRIVLA